MEDIYELLATEDFATAQKLKKPLYEAAMGDLKRGIRHALYTVLMTGGDNDRRLEIWHGHDPEKAIIVVTRPDGVIAKFNQNGDKISGS